jgi:hypothetical protein
MQSGWRRGAHTECVHIWVREPLIDCLPPTAPIDTPQQTTHFDANVNGLVIFGVNCDAGDPRRGRELQRQLPPGPSPVVAAIHPRWACAGKDQVGILGTDVQTPHLDGLVDAANRLPA